MGEDNVEKYNLLKELEHLELKVYRFLPWFLKQVDLLCKKSQKLSDRVGKPHFPTFTVARMPRACSEG